MNVRYIKRINRLPEFKGIEKAEIEYYKQLTQTLDRIEAQIVSLADQQLPRTSW